MSAFHGEEQYTKTFQINLTFTRNTVGRINLRYSGKQEIMLHVGDVSIPPLTAHSSPLPETPYSEMEKERFHLLAKSNCGVWLGRVGSGGG